MHLVVQSALPWVGLGAAAGFVSALAMILPMTRQTEGLTPARVAAGALTGSDDDDVGVETALVVHQLAGVAAGALYGVGLVVVDALLPDVLGVGGVDVLAHLAAVGLVAAFVYAFFSLFVLERYAGVTAEERTTAIRGGWLRSVVVFGVSLAVVVPAALSAA